MQRKSKNGARNREIYAAWESGVPVEQLSAEFGLRVSWIAALLSAERNKIAVSPDPVYRQIRQSMAEIHADA